TPLQPQRKPCVLLRVGGDGRGALVHRGRNESERTEQTDAEETRWLRAPHRRLLCRMLDDEAVCRELVARGDSLVAPRPVSHWVYFRKQPAQQSFSDWAAANGFVVESSHRIGRFRRQYVVE